MLSKPSSLYVSTDNVDLCKATENCFKQKASPVFQLELNVTIDDGTGVADCWISNAAVTGLLPEKIFRDIVMVTRKHGKVVVRTSTSSADERENHGALDFGYNAIGYQGYTLGKVDVRPLVEAIKYVNATPHMLFECARNYKIHSHPQYGDTFCAHERPSIFARNVKCGGFPMRTVCAPGGRFAPIKNHKRRRQARTLRKIAPLATQRGKYVIEGQYYYHFRRIKCVLSYLQYE